METVATGVHACTFCGEELDPTYAECPSCGKATRRVLGRSAWTGLTPGWHFALLWALTFGLYSALWFYRLYRFLRDEARADINPLLRLLGSFVPILGLYWTYAALREVEDFTVGDAWEANVAFGMMWVSAFAFRFLAPGKWVSATLVAAVGAAVWPVQRRINAYYRVHHGVTSGRMPVYGWLLCSGGALFWIAALFTRSS